MVFYHGEFKLQEIVNTQMYNSIIISIVLIYNTAEIGLNFLTTPFHQRTLDIYKGVHFGQQIPTLISIFEMFFKSLLIREK